MYCSGLSAPHICLCRAIVRRTCKWGSVWAAMEFSFYRLYSRIYHVKGIKARFDSGSIVSIRSDTESSVQLIVNWSVLRFCESTIWFTPVHFLEVLVRAYLGSFVWSFRTGKQLLRSSHSAENALPLSFRCCMYRVTKKCFRQKFWNFIKKLFSIEEFL